jgi:AraC family transcriptional regulator
VARLLVNPRNPAFGEDHILLHGLARQHYATGVHAPLSIKAVINGEGRWRTTEGEFLVDSSNLLVVNQDQEYSLTIDAAQPVETFCIFFKPGFLNESAEFRERTHPAGAPLGRRMRVLHAAGANAEPLWIDAQLCALAAEMQELVADERSKAARIPAVKATTRDELFRRVSRAKTWLDTHFDLDPDMEQAARDACLSPYHFHRVFTRTFGMTPHRYVVEKRLARAAYLLSTTRLPVVEVCTEVGFQSLGSFSTLFRTRFGTTPGRARN